MAMSNLAQNNLERAAETFPALVVVVHGAVNGDNGARLIINARRDTDDTYNCWAKNGNGHEPLAPNPERKRFVMCDVADGFDPARLVPWVEDRGLMPVWEAEAMFEGVLGKGIRWAEPFLYDDRPIFPPLSSIDLVVGYAMDPPAGWRLGGPPPADGWERGSVTDPRGALVYARDAAWRAVFFGPKYR